MKTFVGVAVIANTYQSNGTWFNSIFSDWQQSSVREQCPGHNHDLDYHIIMIETMLAPSLVDNRIWLPGGWLIDWLIYWLIYWLIDYFSIDWLLDWFIHQSDRYRYYGRLEPGPNSRLVSSLLNQSINNQFQRIPDHVVPDNFYTLLPFADLLKEGKQGSIITIFSIWYVWLIDSFSLINFDLLTI